ncbi:MAG: LLM class flavin-dependent oxidoreductase [Gammaproteobacteria bacterium]|nr:LLM class flavin-dependent oxidoreductase [Gammaproteobacteria bacterium]
MVSFELRYALRQPESKGDDFQPRYQACVEQCAWGDKLGFTTVMISEHHGSPDGYMSSPMVLGGAIAAVTRGMRIRILSLVGPLHNPVRFAEDLATLDLVSNGRLEPCISGGYVGSEFEAMGTSLSARGEYMDEIVPFLHNAWSGQPFEWKGRTIRVTPRPVQRPGPPIWMGGASKVAARRAARHADVFLPSRRELMKVYYEELERVGRQAPPRRPPTLMVWLAEDKDKFWAEFGPSALHENNAYGKWWTDWNAWNGYVTEESTDALRETGRYPVVTPEELVASIEQFDGHVSVMFHPMAGGADPELAWQSLQLVEDKVIPMLRDKGIAMSDPVP